MSSKKNKNKNRSNKPPNLNPPQKIEETLADDDDVKEEKNESAQKLEERVPEIISEVVTLPVVDSEEKDEDTPKKPKRNRGKKKPQEKNEFACQDEKTVECEESKYESVNLQPEKPENIPEIPEMTPTARKKKNKNKKAIETEEEVQMKKVEVIALEEDIKLKVEVKVEDDFKENVTTPTTDDNPFDQETKSSKKKNKKKKHRTDSERSEKAEELSCVTAFQKLLQDEKSESKIEISEIVIPSSDVEIVSPKNVPCDIVKEMALEENSVIIEPTKNEPKDLSADFSKQPAFESGSKGKKKNKKDKKNPTREDYMEEKEKLIDVLPEVKVETPVEVETHIVEKEIFAISGPLENLIPDVTLATEESSKSTAKIAKPVERKRKGKTNEGIDSTFVKNIKDHDDLLTKEKLQDINSDIILDEQVIEESKSEELKDNKTSSEPILEIREPCQLDELIEIKDAPTKTFDSDSIKVHDSISPRVAEVSKKRKKSPKPSKHIQPTKSQTDTDKEKAEEPTKTQDQLLSTTTSTQEDIIQLQPPICEKEGKLEEIKSEKIAEQTLKTETVKGEQDKAPETKTRKKGKKSSKPPIENKAEMHEPSSSEESQILKSEDIVAGSQLPSEDKTEIFYDLPLIGDIEISSLKADESEGSACGVTPDIIQYPRATSQGFIDDNNNNMMIQEIILVQDTKLQIPIEIPDTPLIHDSGRKPLDTPDIGNVGDIVTSIKVDKPTTQTQQKTELKSKMIEVNQNMEDLKLSIEKSLAELTSIEKSEEEIEKDFVNKILHITEDPPATSQPTELKLSMPSEIVAKSLSEQEGASSPIDKNTKKSTIDKNKPLLITEVVEQPAVQESKDVEVETNVVSILPLEDIAESTVESPRPTEIVADPLSPPVCPARKDHKNKGKSKKKGKHDTTLPPTQTETTPSALTASESADQGKETQKAEHPKQKSETTQEKGKQQSNFDNQNESDQESPKTPTEFDPIENFEDAMTSSADDINRTFEIIADEASQIVDASNVNPEINIIAPIEDTKQLKRDAKVNSVSQPKNLLGHPDIPVPSNRTDYKKEKNKTPNEIVAKVKIKDSIEVDAKKESKESQTDNIRKFMKNKSSDESFSLVNENDDFVYKYSFRRVFLQSACHVCKKELKQTRVPCGYCSLVFYCSGKHKDEDWPQHQALCFAVSTIGHLKDQKHIYSDAKNVTGQNYRLLRMQMIVSCEKVLKRRLVPWEQEALLYPRLCADVGCRQWKQSKLTDCEGCGQISFCTEHPEHFPKSHQRWCKSYSLYQKLVSYQQTKGRLEPKLPSKVMEYYHIPEKMNEVLASMYEEKIDMSDIQYAALTQIATAPLTAAYCYQATSKNIAQTNGTHKKTCTIHVVGAELQFEADALNKWEVFFLHLAPFDELNVAMVATDLNPGNLPLELLSKVKLCEDCRLRNRRVKFSFQDKKSYHDYWAGEDFITPNIVCAFNANINRSSMYNSRDPWPDTVNCILKQRVPFLITGHTLNEVQRDLTRIKECADYTYEVLIEQRNNNFASVRPDRNFISDDEMPLLFKNYCFTLLCGC